MIIVTRLWPFLTGRFLPPDGQNRWLAMVTGDLIRSEYVLDRILIKVAEATGIYWHTAWTYKHPNYSLALVGGISALETLVLTTQLYGFRPRFSQHFWERSSSKTHLESTAHSSRLMRKMLVEVNSLSWSHRTVRQHGDPSVVLVVVPAHP